MKERIAARVRHRAGRMAGAMALCAVVPAGIIAVSMWPSEAASAPAAGGIYNLVPTKSGKCVEVPSGSKDNKALLQQWTCGTSLWQQFQVVASGSYFQLVNANSGKCIDVPSASTTSGTQLWQYTCGTSTNQQWKFVASGTGTYQIISISSGLCISDSGASTANGAAIIQETCSANSNKQFAFNQVGTGSGSGSGSATVASDGTGTYTTVQAAINAVPANNTTRRVITIKAGTYREIVTIPENKPYITLQGLGSDYSKTTIINNRDAGHYGLQGSGTVQAYGDNVVLQNLTVTNDYDENTYETGDQALALYLDADRALLTSVRLLGDQDTFLVDNNARTYVTNSYVEGTVDFIFGAGIAVFNNSTIYQKRDTGGPITAAATPSSHTYGFLFYKCTVNGKTANTVELGRPWGASAQVLYRESTLTSALKIARPWTDMSSNTWQNARFSEYNNTGAGATTNSNRPQMSSSTAANYTPQKYLAGSDGWNPM